MSKANKIFKTDLTLIPTLIAVIYTGINVHIAMENGNHEAWHNWNVIHVISSIAFLVLICIHVKQHTGWYKTIFKRNATKKSITILLSTAMLFETITGIVLLIFIHDEESTWGHLHWVAGLLLTVLGIGHFAKRFKRLKNGLSFMTSQKK